jgi:hemerythrin-like domain-containing protein
MNAVAAMEQEHVVIRGVCDALGVFVGKVRRAGVDARAELGRFVSFLREFSDGCHHQKEEDVLFAAMMRHDPAVHGERVAALLRDHDKVRRHVLVLIDLTATTRPWTDEDRERLEERAGAYHELLNEHIRDEEEIAFPAAERTLSEEAKKEVDSECARVDAMHVADRQALALLGEELIAAYPRPAF